MVVSVNQINDRANVAEPTSAPITTTSHPRLAASQPASTSPSPVDLIIEAFPKRHKEFKPETLHKLAELRKEFLVGGNPGFDCGECSDQLFQTDNSGHRLYLASKNRHETFMTPGSTEGYVYHFIYVKNGSVLDPFVSEQPIPYDLYFAYLKEVNIGVKFAPQGSVPARFNSDEFLRHRTNSPLYGNNKINPYRNMPKD